VVKAGGMLPPLQKLRLVPCPTGMEAEEPWERRVRRRVEALRVTMPDLSPDLVRVVLAAIDTGDAKSACRTASAWCAANSNHRAACLDAGPVFAALSAAIFTPGAPTLVPNDARANFNALCNRIADYEAGRVMLQFGTPDVLIRPFVRAAVQHDPVAALTYAPTFWNDQPLMMEALQIDGMALQFGGLGGSIGPCLAAVRQNGLALQHCADSHRRNHWMLTLVAVQQNGLALQYALDPVIWNKKVQFAAVRQNGNALRYAPTWKRDDYDLVKEAVTNKGGALRWASERLQDNENIVRAAVTDDGSALEYASPQLQGDEEIRAIARTQMRYGASAEGGVVAF
jgi:hypothetical protein